jgi:ElaB/YqjD/DUF883 family membrane-anchored ribosome-binding protein
MSDPFKEQVGRIAADAARVAAENAVEETEAALRRQADETLAPLRRIQGQLAGLIRDRPFAACAVAALAGFTLARVVRS